MGSLFMVSVPIRDYEAILRQKEHHIKIIETEVVDVGSVHLYGSERDIHIPVSVQDSVASSNAQEVDVYNVMVDGQPGKVIVSTDSMSIVQVGDTEDLTKFGGPVVRKRLSDKEHEIRNVIANIFLEKHLEDCLQKFGIMSACWGQSVDGNFSQVAFTVTAEKAENIINHMQTVGIGHKFNSSLCVCAASVYYEPILDKKNEKGDGLEATGSDTDLTKKNKWNEFVASIKSRLTVAQVVQTVKANAVMTFDYIVLIIVAAIIAGLGLIDDSSVNVVASMLVSPLMGPIMATTFGAVIREKDLIKIGLASELVGLLICLIVGLTFGVFLQAQPFPGPWYNVEKWPTDQMRGRSEYRSLQVGVGIAIPSGCGVALSILAGNSGSLVGVAISASLLPPAVNCGILWGMAMVICIKQKIAGHDPLVGCSTPLFSNGTSDYPDYLKFYSGSYKPIHCKNAVKEYAVMGIVSFGLTWLNIILIFFVGVIILKIKEVAPHTTRTSLNRFWKEDLKVARQYNTSNRGGTMDDIIENLDESGQKDIILKKLENDQVFNAVNRRTGLPMSTNVLSDIKRKGMDSSSREDVSKPAAASSWGGWFGGLWGSKPEEPAPPPTPEVETGRRGLRPKLL